MKGRLESSSRKQMNSEHTSHTPPHDDIGTIWPVILWPLDLDRRGYAICVLVAGIAVGAWILTGILDG
jgi:hypothetical protein